MERLYKGQLQNFLNGYQAGSGAGMIYQLAPACGSLYGHASLYPALDSTTHFPELSRMFSSAWPPIVLLNAGSFPTALQRVLAEKLTRQVRSGIYKQETHLYDLEKKSIQYLARTDSPLLMSSSGRAMHLLC